MKKSILLSVLFCYAFVFVSAQTKINKPGGSFSVGTRNTISKFDDKESTGMGIGAQFRIQFSKRINSEWFFDYIGSKKQNLTYRNDYHIGWSLMFYPGKQIDFQKLLQPYFLAGHCFDYTRVTEQDDKTNTEGRWSLATQAGLGTHINFSPRFDCSLSGQYMFHLGKEIETTVTDDVITIEKKDFSGLHGHFLLTIGFNYKIAHLW